MIVAYACRKDAPRTASLGRRAAAFSVDAAIVFVLAWTLTSIAAATGMLSIPDIEVLGEVNRAAGLLWIVSIFELPVLLLYFTLLEGYGGRTPGKMLLGLRVARIEGERNDVFHSFLRNLLRLLWVTPFGPVFVVLDWWTLHVTELDQRMGDLAAGTIVLDER